MLKKLWVIVVFILILIVLAIYNNFKKYRNKIKEKNFLLQNLFKKRLNLILDFAEVLKEYPDFKSETLDKLNILKTQNYDTLKLKQKIEIDNNISKVCLKIIEIADKNPDLKENEQYIKLSKELLQIDKDISKANKEHKSIVKEYNNKIEIFPNNLVAILFGFNEEK